MKMKNSTTKITQIAATPESEYNNTTIFGLGSDGKIYRWIRRKEEWCLFDEFDM